MKLPAHFPFTIIAVIVAHGLFFMMFLKEKPDGVAASQVTEEMVNPLLVEETPAPEEAPPAKPEPNDQLALERNPLTVEPKTEINHDHSADIAKEAPAPYNTENTEVVEPVERREAPKPAEQEAAPRKENSESKSMLAKKVAIEPATKLIAKVVGEQAQTDAADPKTKFDVTDLSSATEDTYSPKTDAGEAVDMSDSAVAAALKVWDENRHKSKIASSPVKSIVVGGEDFSSFDAPIKREERAFIPLHTTAPSNESSSLTMPLSISR